MAEKKYQFFISSTFSDLADERQLAVKAILDLDHIPSGMELFPAIDMEQFEYIKKVIDECDYYLLIIGARYGSTDPDGVSFTEREFDYAVSIGKTVIVFIHGDIESLPKKHFDDDTALTKKLVAFRERVMTGRMVRMWKNRDQLVAAMMQAITKAISTYPAVGWIRGDQVAGDDIMQDYVQLRKHYDELANAYNTLLAERSPALEGLASLDEEFEIHYRYKSQHGSYFSGKLALTWADILKIVGPDLYSPKTIVSIKTNVRHFIARKSGRSNLSLEEMDVDTIKVHLAALGLLEIRVANATTGGLAEFISLTENGQAELLRRMAVRSKGASHPEE